MSAFYTRARSSYRASNLQTTGTQPELHRKGATLSLVCCAMKPGHLLHSALRVGMHGISNRDTHVYLPHNSIIHLTTTTEMRCSGWITDGMRSGCRTLRDSIPSSRYWHPPSWNGPAKNSMGPELPLLHCCRTFPLLFTQMGNGPFYGLCVWHGGTNR